MLKWILAAVATVVVVFLIVVALQPSDFKVERSATMRAPAPAAFAQVNDFHNWRAWSPWEKIDPALKRQYEGPEGRHGRSLCLAGQQGRRRRPHDDHREPAGRAGAHQARVLQAVRGDEYRRIQLQARGRRTAVTWTMTGQNNFLSKAICLFVDMDKMVGGMFEQGLGADEIRSGNKS